ncbi:MAG: LptF/LptG family permease, partial [Acidobacteriaceae bacterium]|nr:LptF/LptG family permease [Acidobacteriaceae bacterium]
MFRILDRYLVKEVALPFILSLIVLTFILEVQSILTVGEEFIAKGVEWAIVARVLVTLLPQALCLTIPMAVLMGILVGLSRLSADREFVAMQACGVSLMRLARPVLLVATIGTAATAYQMIVALPDANQTFRDIAFVQMAERVESNVKPGVFFQDFAPKVLYVRDVRPEGGWRDVFVADTSAMNETVVTFAKEGRIHLDREQRLVQLELSDVTTYTTRADAPDDYEQTFAASHIISLDPNTVFKRPQPRGAREMTYAELNQEIEAAKARNDPAYEAHFMRQQKLSLPLTCPILALMALALGVTNRKDGKLASFALGAAVIFIYYVLLWGARAASQGGRLDPELAPWTPNILMGVATVVMLVWRTRFADQQIAFSLPAFWRRDKETDVAVSPAAHNDETPRERPARPRVVVVIRVPP